MDADVPANERRDTERKEEMKSVRLPRIIDLLQRVGCTAPEVAAKVPVIAFMVVVLPAPLEPIRDTNSPSRTSKLMPLTACMPP